MDRFVIMVDAGYLFAAAGDICHGTSSRRDLLLDPTKVTASLVDICQNHSGQRYLRTYWYDAAADALPTPEHNGLADQRGLKLRLGRMVHGGQKGVDSRIVRDLIVLPRNGAVGTIYLMSGDEDVREGVVEAQELGVSVILIGIEAQAGKRNQAQTLVREADDHIILPRTDCERFLAARSTASASAGSASQGGPSVPTLASHPIHRDDVQAFGTDFAAAWKANNDADARAKLLGARPAIPVSIDGPLMRDAKRRFGGLDEATRRVIRAAFWKEIIKS